MTLVGENTGVRNPRIFEVLASISHTIAQGARLPANADQALCRAKGAKRNRTVVYGEAKSA